MKRRIFSFLMALVMVLSILPMPALAADGLCEHHPAHTADCNYAAPVVGQPCSHEGKCSVDTCGYVPAQPGVPCGHTHDETCGWSAGAGEVPCDKGCAEADENGVIIHAEGCAYAPAVAETPCSHQCSFEVCGYVAPVEGVKCGHEHDGTCGYVQAVEGHACTFDCQLCKTKCTCQVKCNEQVNQDCPLCSVSTEGCQGKAVADTPVCNCADQCTAEAVKADCPVCGGENADLTNCKGTPAPAVTENAKAVQSLIDALPTLEEVQAMTMEEQGNIYNQTQAAYEAYKLLTEEEQAQVDVSKFEALFGYFNTLTSPLPDDGLVSVAEQYPGITNGNTYWFDLSSVTFPGTSNMTNSHWIPFIYAGTVNAYVLNSTSSGVTTSSNDAATNSSSTYGSVYDHSLFIAQNYLTQASWTDLNNKGLIFASTSNYTNGGIDYTLRAPSVGSGTSKDGEGMTTGVIPNNNEWDAIRAKSLGSFASSGMKTWGQDTGTLNGELRATRDGNSSSDPLKEWDTSTASGSGNANPAYRPVLELPSTLGANDVKVVTVNLNGGKIGESTPTDPINLVVSASGFTAPSGKGLKPPTETDAANVKAFLGWKGSDDKIYAAGASVPDTVTTLTAQWVESLTTYNIWVGNKQVEFIKKDDVLGGADEGATVTYDPITNTLTLNGANITSVHTWTASSYNHSAGIYAEGDLNIVLADGTTNTVATSTTDANAYGIYTGGDLTISGTGTINAKASSTGEQVSYGMCANTVTISGGKGTASGESGAVSGTLSFQDGITYEGEQTDNSMTWGYGENEAFTVAYDVNGGTGSVPKGGSYPANTSVTVQNKTSNMEKTGHTFAGWNTSAEGTGVSYAAGDTFQITADTTLYAKWTADPVTVTGVELNKSEITLTVGGSETLIATVKPDNATNKAVTWKSGDETVATVDANGKVTALKAGSATITVTTVDGNKTATCTVTVNPASTGFTVTFDSNGGSTVDSQTVAKNGQVSKPTDPTKKDMKFGGWFKAEDWKDDWDFEKDKVTENITIHAQWLYTYKVDFRDNTSAHVSNMPKDIETDYPEEELKIRIPPNKPRRGGYTFEGWNTKSDGKGKWYDPGEDVPGEKNGTVTLYAQWEQTSGSWWDNPKTGDYIMIAVGVLVVSGAALAGLLVYSKKKKK